MRHERINTFAIEMCILVVSQVALSGCARKGCENVDTTNSAISNEYSTRMYAFDNNLYAQHETRRSVENSTVSAMAERWERIKLIVAFCSTQETWLEFRRTQTVWSGGFDQHITTIRGPQQKEIIVKDNDCVVIKGDSNAPIRAGKAGVIHILGNLNSKLISGEHTEIVVGGDIGVNATLKISGITRAYVGGNVEGRIEAVSTFGLWANGDLRSHIAGNSLYLHVMGDCDADIRRLDKDKVAGIRLDVRGFMPYSKIANVCEDFLPTCQISVNESDKEPGVYCLDRFERGRNRFGNVGIHGKREFK